MRFLHQLARETRGDVAVEYIVLVGVIALPAIGAFIAAGKVIVEQYAILQTTLILPVP